MKNRRWDRDRIRSAIQSQYRRGWDISYCAMARRNQALVSAANYHFGSYRQAVLMAGIDYDRMRRKPHWTPRNVVALIRRAHRNRQDLSWRAVISRGDELARAAMAAVHPQLFGRWNDALQAAGIDPERVARYHRWTRPRIIEELQRRFKARKCVNSGTIQAELPGMYGAAVRIFGSYEQALRSAGIDPDAVRQRRQWTRAAVIEALTRFQQEHGAVSHALMREKDSGLLRATFKFFGTLRNARLVLNRTQPAMLGLSDPGSNGRPRRRRKVRSDPLQPTLFDDLPESALVSA